jgi:hypothetical protein
MSSHAHAHAHAHEHAHAHSPVEAAGNASVALDIGDGRGALVIYPGERYRGREIELSLADGDGPRVHTGVHERSSDAGARLTAIFGSLAEGEYVVWQDEHTPGATVVIEDGAITELQLH